ncbi:hypothetical protein A2696_00125 [Candidatus Curtissbacteria bacterium RIFCSPHIGHO2_01_FULL_41_13]|uniref:SGNH hydrolase-type esterase domain-containing protein n=1 Tax=Candidatus Curtissbacteria bacterium RIFCSPHIGHO2_01_FULL_41_13 TaxID=1797745 RepID=A0A1F5FZT8_9BACT|nr:MAG: hypothetical protein A2696_00125 [Candidatus Curtissbacteria bacterium RIFCSPHIGHO2_01_FULL_41_13]
MKDRFKKILLNLKQSLITRLHKKEKFTFVAMGDSTVEGIGASDKTKSFASVVYDVLKKENRNAKFHNLGKSGARIKDIIDNQLQEGLDLNPDLVLISVGVNDLRARTKIADFERDLKYLLETITSQAQARMIINSIPDFSNLPSVPFFVRFYVRSAVKKFNNVLKKQVQESDATFVDLHSGASIFTKNYPELISSDGFHPSDIGYAFWAAAIISQASELLFKKSGR